MRIKIFADGADLAEMHRVRERYPAVVGFTTNPSLARAAGVRDYLGFARDAAAAFPELPLSLEVIADEFNEMARQARVLSALGPNVYVKIPITNTRGELATGLVYRLTSEGIKVNVTAVMTSRQLLACAEVMTVNIPTYVSIFAGRIADTGRDPVPIIRTARAIFHERPAVEVIWASPRELLNIVQADDAGCHIITMPETLLAKLALLGKDLNDHSLDTVRMFAADARAAGYVL